MKAWILTIVCAVSIVAGCDREPTTQSPAATPDRDNTGVNARDRDATTQTAGQQSQAKSDIDIAAEIRRKVVDTKMSINAQNSKIIVVGGKVTLRGPVKTLDEKDNVGRIAAEVAGAGNVDNQLEVEVNN